MKVVVGKVLRVKDVSALLTLGNTEGNAIYWVPIQPPTPGDYKSGSQPNATEGGCEDPAQDEPASWGR